MILQEIDPEIKKLLLDGEEILLVASQSRFAPGGSFFTPNKIYITNRRVLFMDPRWMGLKAETLDASYKDISNIRLNRGVFSSEIFLKARFWSQELKLPAVDKNIAQQVNTMIQRGIRGELPGQIISEGKTVPVIKTVKHSDSLEELEKLSNMKQKGILTEDEFNSLKLQLLMKPSG